MRTCSTATADDGNSTRWIVDDGSSHAGKTSITAERLLRFGQHCRQIARPFQRTFTRHDLNNLIARIDRHEPQLALGA